MNKEELADGEIRDEEARGRAGGRRSGDRTRHERVRYFSSTGSGTGTATVGSSSAVELTSPSVGPLYPGGADVPVDVTIHNPGSGSEYVNHVSGSVADNAGCLGSWFQVDGFNYANTLGAGASATVQTQVRMLNQNLSQDACQGSR